MEAAQPSHLGPAHADQQAQVLISNSFQLLRRPHVQLAGQQLLVLLQLSCRQQVLQLLLLLLIDALERLEFHLTRVVAAGDVVVGVVVVVAIVVGENIGRYVVLRLLSLIGEFWLLLLLLYLY